MNSAIKLLRPELKNEASHENSQKNEVLITRRLPHAGLCSVHDIYNGPNGKGIMISLIEGCHLGEWLAIEKRSVAATAEERVDLLRKVADAIRYAHEILEGEPVVHLDRSPRT